MTARLGARPLFSPAGGAVVVSMRPPAAFPVLLINDRVYQPMDQHHKYGPFRWGRFKHGPLVGYNAGLRIGRYSVGVSIDWRTDK